MSEIVYIKMKEALEVSQAKTIYLKDIAFISTTSTREKEIENQKIYQITKKDRNIVVLDSFMIIKHLNKDFEHLNMKLIGPTQTLVKVEKADEQKPLLLVLFVWILLFIGAAMTIMNFHYDVSMQEVQQKLHFMMTGEENKRPLWIQIPYSLGLGLGMLLFLNHWFQKKFNEEPSPLEIELFNYQKNLNDYMKHDENKYDD